MTAVPEGFELMPPYGRFGEFIGPIYWKEVDGAMVIGLRVEEHHCGIAPFLHGGMVASLVDTAFTWATRRLYDASLGIVTTNLSIDYIGGAGPGDWVEARVDVVRSGKRLTFLSCFVWKGEERIARASAQFQAVPRDKRPVTLLRTVPEKS